MRGGLRKYHTASLIIVAGVLSSCGITEPNSTPAAIAIVKGDGQEAVAGSVVPESLVVELRNSAGVPIAASVSFRVIFGGGTVSPATVQTGADGRARTQWTLGTTVGAQAVSVGAADNASVPEVVLRAKAKAGAIAAISVTPDSSGILETKSGQLGAAATDRFGNVDSSVVAFTWASDSPSIATVSPTGTIRAVAPGIARIIVSAHGVSGSARIVVTKGTVSTLVLATNTGVIVRDSTQLVATARNAEGDVLVRQATWSSSDSRVAAVTSTGVVIGAEAGTATITASVDGKTATTPVVVGPRPLSIASTASIAALSAMMDMCHTTFSVYSDVSSPCSHFHAFGKIPNQFAPVTVNGSETTIKHFGATSIKFALLPSGGPFGGYYLLAGRLPKDSVAPIPDFGTVPNAGYNLTGATDLSFWVRGRRGGEVVDFFVGGVGRDPDTGDPHPLSPYPESALVSKIRVTLTTQWQRVVIPLAGQDLTYMLDGFGWVASVDDNPQGAEFYVDDITFELSAAAKTRRLQEPRFVTSFLTKPLQPDPFDNVARGDIDFVLRNTAFSYDNALAILAFLAARTAEGLARAELIGKAFVYAVQHDRTFTDGRVRTAYSSGDLKVPPAWTPNGKLGTVTIPGFYIDSQVKFYEVEQHASDVGNNAWTMIALLALHRRTGNAEYLAAARTIGTFIQQFSSESGTYRGFQGGFDQPEVKAATRRPWASVEHNLDVHAAFSVMYEITREAQWATGAAHAKVFVEAMWEAARGCNLAGTDNPNVLNQRANQLPVDVQAWYVLAIRDALTVRPSILQCAERYHRLTADGYTGFDFNNDRDGVWFEGTGHMAAAYTAAAQSSVAASLLSELRGAQLAAAADLPGGIWAAPRDGISTGFDVALSPTQSVPFELFRRIHVGATAWHVFAELGVNPYYVR